MKDALDFAQSVLAAATADVTHLKLQKLTFYAYGAAVAARQSVPFVQFQHWKHGPVCVPVYEHFKGAGSTTLVPEVFAEQLSGAARDAVRVYGALSAWQLREESHLEAPWRDTELGQDIPNELVVEHFRAKFSGRVRAPMNLLGSWSLAVDGLPALTAATLGELASALGR